MNYTQENIQQIVADTEEVVGQMMDGSHNGCFPDKELVIFMASRTNRRIIQQADTCLTSIETGKINDSQSGTKAIFSCAHCIPVLNVSCCSSFNYLFPFFWWVVLDSVAPFSYFFVTLVTNGARIFTVFCNNFYCFLYFINFIFFHIFTSLKVRFSLLSMLVSGICQCK